ncbi:Hypothetical predicted protein [Scomber scombrus]|uniref:Uncharacterized protein n=1 Tax=Scomber scombrus TaxID=13677 RepID=A0AAV1P2Y7_SCOSC
MEEMEETTGGKTISSYTAVKDPSNKEITVSRCKRLFLGPYSESQTRTIRSPGSCPSPSTQRMKSVSPSLNRRIQ